MTICRDWSIVKYESETRHCRPLYCRSWSCDVCQPKRRAQLMANAAAGAPNRFLTLTVNPTIGDSPEQRLRLLARAWRVAVQRLRRLYGPKSIDYLAIVEETKQGEPHLHVLLRSVYIPQPLISSIMRELIDSPIVDIRAIKSIKHVVHYIAKYIAKAPAQFGKSKRYWSSRTWEVDSRKPQGNKDPDGIKWVIEMRTIEAIVTDWIHTGWLARKDRDDLIIAWPFGGSPPRRAGFPSRAT